MVLLRRVGCDLRLCGAENPPDERLLDGALARGVVVARELDRRVKPPRWEELRTEPRDWPTRLDGVLRVVAARPPRERLGAALLTRDPLRGVKPPERLELDTPEEGRAVSLRRIQERACRFGIVLPKLRGQRWRQWVFGRQVRKERQPFLVEGLEHPPCAKPRA